MKPGRQQWPFAVFLVPAIIAAEVLGQLRKQFARIVEAAARGGTYEDEAVSVRFAFLDGPQGVCMESLLVTRVVANKL